MRTFFNSSSSRLLKAGNSGKMRMGQPFKPRTPWEKEGMGDRRHGRQKTWETSYESQWNWENIFLLTASIVKITSFIFDKDFSSICQSTNPVLLITNVTLKKERKEKKTTPGRMANCLWSSEPISAALRWPSSLCMMSSEEKQGHIQYFLVSLINLFMNS